MTFLAHFTPSHDKVNGKYVAISPNGCVLVLYTLLLLMMLLIFG